MNSADTLFSCTPITSHKGKPSYMFFVETSITCLFSIPASVPIEVLSTSRVFVLCRWDGEAGISYGKSVEREGERQWENGRRGFQDHWTPTPSYSPSKWKSLAKKQRNSVWWGEDMMATRLEAHAAGNSFYPQEWRIERFLEGQGICKCYTAFPFIFYFIWKSHQSRLQPLKLWPQRRPDSPTENWELPVAISISYCSPLTDTKHRKAEGKGEADCQWKCFERPCER